MEAPQEHDSANRNNSSYLCRQSSTRWTPTSDQIRILKELYYNNGIRSPTADQIQRIAARLRQYGKIEGKNVFYWFQNHKARERQKKRFTPATAPPPPATATLYPSSYPHTAGVHVQSHHFYNQQHKLYINPPQTASSSSQGFMAVGCGYGSVSMEKSFRDCSISHGEMIGTGVESYFLDKIKPTSHGSLDEEDGGGELSPEVETLPLFPVNDGATTAGVGRRDVFNVKAVEDSPDHYYTGGNWFRSDGRTSLELSLNSYGYYN